MACWMEVEVPKRQQVTALPSREMVSTIRGPCLAATVAYGGALAHPPPGKHMQGHDVPIVEM